MKRVIQLIVFASLFTLVYFGLNYYVLSEFFSLLSIVKTSIFYVLWGVLSLSFIVAMIIERNAPNILTRYVYLIASCWLGIMFFSFFVFICLSIIGLFVKIDNSIVSPLIFGSIIVVSIYSIWNGQITNIKNIEIGLPGLRRKINAVQLSDIHMGTVRSDKFLEKIVSKVNDLNPEVVFITGDLFDGSAPLTSESIKPLDKLKAPVYFVIGNHEIYDGLEGVMKLLKKTKIKVLRSEKSMFKNIQIIGVDFSEDREHLAKELPKIKIDKNKPSILLYHPPAHLKYLSEFGIGLQLSGHTHSGQIFPFNLFVRLAFPYVRGYHKEGKSQIYISQGTGTWGPPMRLGSKNEITNISFIPSS